MEAKGINGTLEFNGKVVVIKRVGFMAKMTMGGSEKRIPIKHITAVQWKDPGKLSNGYIAFTIPGGAEKQSKYGRQSTDAAKDENAVLIGPNHVDAFRELRDAIEEAIS